MLRLALALAVLSLAACRTHRVEACLPPCGPADQSAFAACVASGESGCEAGNRRCCALAAGCLGALEDQSVVTSDITCLSAEEETCWPPCSAEDRGGYELCLAMGGALCGIGDELCCALEQDCLGELGEVLVYADGCCASAEDCGEAEVCDLRTGTCRRDAGCGDGVLGAGESCDPGPRVELRCVYGAMSCVVCSAACEEIAGETSYCGDGETDPEAEGCDPPDGVLCDEACQPLAPSSCGDGAISGDETDIDCGGSCPPCGPGQGCRIDRDCRPASTACNEVAACDVELTTCVDVPNCDDALACTEDTCRLGAGCVSMPIDADRDGDGPLGLGCGGDCNDADPTSSSRVRADLGCTTGEAGFGVDNDCDGFFDEDC